MSAFVIEIAVCQKRQPIFSYHKYQNMISQISIEKAILNATKNDWRVSSKPIFDATQPIKYKVSYIIRSVNVDGLTLDCNMHIF